MADDPDVTMSFVTDFRCTGDECPDNCCHSWQVHLDQGSYSDLKRATSCNQAEHARFQEVVKRNEDQGPEAYATIALQESGACSFQEDSGLCSIQKNHGEALLGQVCSTYPRHINRFGERKELSLALSCPEAARLCLSTKGAVDLVGLSPELVANAKYLIHQRSVADEPNPYLRHMDVIRGIMWELLGLEDYPLDSRLFFAAYFAKRITSFFHQGMSEEGTQQLAEEVDRLLQPKILVELDQQFRKVRPANDLSLTIVLTILVGRGRGNSSLKDRLQGIWKNYGGSGFEEAARHALETGESKFDFSSVIRQYRKRVEHLEPLFKDAHELHMRNYCSSFLFKETYTTEANPLLYVQNLLIRRAMFRFLVFSDPRANDWMANPVGKAPSADELDVFSGISVDLLYRLCRAIEHSDELNKQIRRPSRIKRCRAWPIS